MVDPVVLQAVVVGFFAKRLDPVAVPGAARSRATLADHPYVDRRRGERPRQIDRPAADRDADVLDLAEQGDRPDGHGARRGDPAPLAQDGVADRLAQLDVGILQRRLAHRGDPGSVGRVRQRSPWLAQNHVGDGAEVIGGRGGPVKPDAVVHELGEESRRRVGRTAEQASLRFGPVGR